MKFLTTNFVQCAVRSCGKTQECFPLKYSDVEMVQQEVDFDPTFIINILPKLRWEALVQVAQELGNNTLPPQLPEMEDPYDPEHEQLIKDLHNLLLETQIIEGTMTCRNCGHSYFIKSSIPNFLLPPHLA